tara:strand:- start:470 stop:682 length:213 start_codon:yes stop_codon:yes gene_type:complete
MVKKSYTIRVELEGSFARDVKVEADTLDDAVREAVDITWDRANQTPLHEMLTSEWYRQIYPDADEEEENQ